MTDDDQDECNDRECTCLGSCKGAAGLALGWRCALDKREDPMRDRCVLGADCLCPHIFHGPDECFDAEMAEQFMGDSCESTTISTDTARFLASATADGAGS